MGHEKIPYEPHPAALLGGFVLLLAVISVGWTVLLLVAGY